MEKPIFTLLRVSTKGIENKDTLGTSYKVTLKSMFPVVFGEMFENFLRKFDLTSAETTEYVKTVYGFVEDEEGEVYALYSDWNSQLMRGSFLEKIL